MLYELNWRLETALVPLFAPWADMLAGVFDRFDPFPHLRSAPTAPIHPNAPVPADLDWARIRDCWVEIGFALARAAREVGDIETFRARMELLGPVARQRGEWQARWNHEECLFHLARLDHDRVRATLGRWPEMAGLPLWELKRAAIRSELGEWQTATREAAGALAAIRAAQQPYRADYALLSQEGWAMQLLDLLANNAQFLGTEDYNSAESVGGAWDNDRWDRLSSYRCNPKPEIELAGTIVDTLLRDRRADEESGANFDPGRRRRITEFSTGSTLFKLLPAYAFLRFYEEAPIPPVCGAALVYGDTLMSAARLAAPFTPRLALGAMLRGGPRDAVERWFDRVGVATMATEEITQTEPILSAALQQALRRTGTSQRNLTIPTGVLSRLSLRLDADGRAALFDLAVALYRHQDIRRDTGLYDRVDDLFRRLFLAMPRSEIIERVATLLSLPLPGAHDFVVRTPEFWQDPLNRVIVPGDIGTVSEDERAAWSEPIADLLQAVRSRPAPARGVAAQRLSQLIEIDGLTPDERSAFADALWSRTDGRTGLPAATGTEDWNGLYVDRFLALPEREPGRARQLVRRYLLDADFTRVTDGDGNVRLVRANEQLLREWLGSVGLYAPGRDRDQFIDWSADEVARLLEKLVTWWDEEKRALITSAPSMVADEVRNQLQVLSPLLRYIVLPRLGPAGEETRALADRLLREMAESGIDVLQPLPWVLLSRPDAYAEVSRRFRGALHSPSLSRVDDALAGLVDWLIGSAGSADPGSDLPGPPGEMLDDLVNWVRTRRQPGLRAALEGLARIVERRADLFSEGHLASLHLGLEYLLEETALPSDEEQETGDRFVSVIVRERPEHRAATAWLARSLDRSVGEQSARPQILSAWEAACATDPLPEVRRAWSLPPLRTAFE